MTITPDIFDEGANTPGVIGIDPGTTQTGFVLLSGSGKPLVAEIIPNDEMIKFILESPHLEDGMHCVIEMIASYGMAVGASVFWTCVSIGEFSQAWKSRFGARPKFMFRKSIKMHLCNSNKAKDANIRAALIDKFGGSKQAAIGLKASPGPLYGFKADMWAALGVAVTYRETNLVMPF